MHWNEQLTTDSIPERFQWVADAQPDAVAIAGAGAPITYGELRASAFAYAAILPEARATPPAEGGVAALLFDHGPSVIVAALAALLRGCTIISLNPSDPPGRHALLRELVEPSMLLTDVGHVAHAARAGFERRRIAVLDVARDAPDRGAQIAACPEPDALAVLISTSGSTGFPKVVMQSHRNMLHNVLRYTNGLGIRREDRIAWLAALSGGQGLATAWTALLGGATLCPFPIAQRGVTGLRGWLEEQSVTVLDTLPSVLRNFSLTLRDQRIRGVRLVRLASEAALATDFEAFRRHFTDTCRLATVLGSSETGIAAQAILDSSLVPGERLPVGFEAEGITVSLRAEDGHAVDDGQAGEIVIASRYLSPGYWRDPELTEQRFEQDGDERRFRTGDIARRNGDGMLEIVGRRDSQVKVRGHRLQLEEVESAIAALPGVAAATVTADSTARGDTRLTAYVAPSADVRLNDASLRDSLRSVLPPHAVPATVVFLDALPMNAHGKVDRARLAELAAATATATAAWTPSVHPPISETEEVVAGIWREAFDRNDIGRDDQFLELGGDSLTAAVIAAGIDDAFGLELGLGAFASEITIARLAAMVDNHDAGPGKDEELPRLTRRESAVGGVPPHGRSTAPASFVQQDMWRADRVHPEGLILATGYRVSGPLDREALRRSIESIVARHETLRTTFALQDGDVVQVVREPVALGLPLFDVRGDADPERRAAELLAIEARESFDLERGPLLRFRLVCVGDDEHILLRINHHLIADAPSWQMLFAELAGAYQAEVAGIPAAVDEVPLQYADFATWERAVMELRQRPAYRAEVEWWADQLANPPAGWSPWFRREQPLESDPGTPSMIEWGLVPDLSNALNEIGREGGATYYMTRLAVYAALLALDHEVDDIVIESFFSSRRRPELHRMLGLFINRTLLRLRFPGELGFRQWLGDVRRTVIDTSTHSSIPHGRLREELLETGVQLPVPVTRFAAVYQLPETRFAALKVVGIGREQLTPRGFVLGVDRNHDSTGCRAVFDPRFFDPSLVEEFVNRLKAFAGEICARPDAPLTELHRSRSEPVGLSDR
jgi:non-ribosomal peptide synthetase component F/acyl carrier protein